MKLDRNTNNDRRGKYALVNMRKLKPIIDGSPHNANTQAVTHAISLLCEQGLITFGTESPGDQFFVMKYKDKFTADGLQGYATAAAEWLKKLPEGDAKYSMSEYVAEMFDESHAARKVGNHIPD